MTNTQNAVADTTCPSEFCKYSFGLEKHVLYHVKEYLEI